MDSLASLQIGEAWFWSPGRDIFERIKIRKKHTFDSSATPKAGERRIDPKVVAPVDLNKLKAALSSVIENAKSNDPMILKTKIRELEAKIKQLEARKPDVASKPNLKPTRTFLTGLSHTLKKMAEDASQLEDELRTIDLGGTGLPAGIIVTPEIKKAFKEHFSKPKDVVPLSGIETSALGKCERTILRVLLTLESCSKEHLAVKSVYSVNSGGFKNAISRLRTLGYLDGSGESLSSTSAARMNYEPVNILPQNDLVAAWAGCLDKCERTLLEALNTYGPRTKATLATNTGYQETSGGFKNALSRLRTLCLINRGDPVALSEYMTA